MIIAKKKKNLTFYKPYNAYSLLNFNVERNFISQTWIKKYDFPKNQSSLKEIQTVNEWKIICYKHRIFNFTLIDFNSTFKNWKFSTHVIDMSKYDFILNYSWLCKTKFEY